jgi:hypothetical protein
MNEESPFLRQWRDEIAYFHATGKLFPPNEDACPCAGTGWLGREWLHNRAPACTCGAGDPNDGDVFHTVECDAVPCPFCPLETS